MSYYVEPFTFDFETNRIVIDSGVTDVDCATLYDASKLAQASEEGIIYDRIGKGTGLDQLGPGVQVGITVELLGSWQLSFAAGNYIAKVAGGNLIGGPGGDPIAYSAGVQALLIQSANALVVSTSGSGATAAEVWTYAARSLSTAGNTGVSSAVRTELSTELGRIDATVSSRALETTAQGIKAKTDNLPAAPAAVSDVPTASQVATQVRTELSTELSRIDVAVSTRNAIAPLDSSATQAAAAAALVSYDPPTKGELDAAQAAIIAAVPSAAGNATAVRSELSTELGRLDISVSSRAQESTAQGIKAKTDLIPVTPASQEKVQEAVDAAKLAVALSA